MIETPAKPRFFVILAHQDPAAVLNHVARKHGAPLRAVLGPAPGRREGVYGAVEFEEPAPALPAKARR